MATCVYCGIGFKPANSDHHPFCSERCQHNNSIEESENENAFTEEIVPEIICRIGRLEATVRRMADLLAKHGIETRDDL